MIPRPDSNVVASLVSDVANTFDQFTLVDVGASGGIADYWSAFGATLRATGFDPLVANMQRMASSESRPQVKYEAAYVGCGDDPRRPTDAVPGFTVSPYERSSSVRAQEVKRIDYIAENYNDGAPVVRTDRRITLDGYFHGRHELDFLKVDTDGHDIEVLLGAERLFDAGAFLGILVESPFQGRLHEYANTFANVNRYLADHGFILYDFDRHRYSRAALPGLFVYDIPAQTTSGQVFLSDALYFRDLAHPTYAEYWNYEVTRARMLKLVALFDLFGLPDCAAELLLARPNLTSDREREQLLDLLVASAGFSGTYAEHVAGFDADIQAFYPSARVPQASPAESAEAVASRPTPPPRRPLLKRLGHRMLRKAGLR